MYSSNLEDTGVIEESIQEDSLEAEQSQNPNSFDTSDDEGSQESDEVDKSGMSNRERLSPSKIGNNSTNKQQRQHIRSPEEESDDDSEAEVSYHVKGMRPAPEMEHINQYVDPDDTYQVIQAGKRPGKMAILSSEENSVEPSDAEDLAIQKSNSSASSSGSSHSLDDSIPHTTKKKKVIRNRLDSNSDSSFDASMVRKPSITSDESDSSIEPTPHVRRERAKGKRVVKHIESDDSEEESSPPTRSPIVHRVLNKIDSDVSTEEDVPPATLRISPRVLTPQSMSRNPVIQKAVLVTSFDRHDSGNGSTMEHNNQVSCLDSTCGYFNNTFIVFVFFKEGSKQSTTAFEKKSQHPPKSPEEDVEIPIQDLSNSILEVSSTEVSFSSPEVQDQSIEEITSPSEISLPILPVTLSAAEVVRMREDLERKKLLMRSCRLESLPDGGAKLKDQICQLTEKLKSAAEVRPAPIFTSVSDSEVQEDELRKQLQMKKVTYTGIQIMFQCSLRRNNFNV